jgi:hypothetical protein
VPLYLRTLLPVIGNPKRAFVIESSLFYLGYISHPPQKALFSSTALVQNKKQKLLG